MASKQPIICEIAKNTYAINEYGMGTAYLLVGDERALLIDAGVGTLDLKEIISSLTDKPYIVAMSHGHGDHIGGVYAFDEIYIHPTDRNEIELLDWDFLKNYVQRMLDMGSAELYDVKPEDVRVSSHIPQMLDLYEGQVLELGNRPIEIIETPGHTIGSVVFLDSKTRILFSGDACNINLGLSATSVNTALCGLDKIKAREAEFDRNYNGHIGYANRPTCFSMPESVLDDCIKICDDILAGKANVQKMEGMQPAYRANFVTYGAVRISFDPERLIDNGEKPVR